jgi:RNA polymerase sigma-70 factor (ECF subfamily)
MNPSDEQVLVRVQRGERGAYVALFDRYYPRVYRYARWHSGDPDLATDAASETFVRAYCAVDGFRTEDHTPYLAYLLQICRRILMSNRFRQSSNRTESLDESDSEARRLIDSCPPPLEYVLEEEQREMIRQSLLQLAPLDREIIALAYEQDLSRRDIAALMGKPSTTAVTTHLYRAMQKLREAVNRQGYFGAIPGAERT